MSFEPVSFASQLVATLIGAGVAFALVVRWDRTKKKTEGKETENLIIDSLVAELKENLSGLNNFKMPTWDITKGKFNGNFGLVSAYAFQSIVNGGDFLVLPITLQKPVREIYQNTELFNKFMNEVIGFSSFQLNPNQASLEANELIRRLQDRKSALQTSIPDTITKLTSIQEK